MAGSNSYLLDTSIVIAYFRHDTYIKEKLKGSTFYLSSIVLGELYLGANKSSQRNNNLRQIQQLLTICTVLVCDSITAEHYGEIKHALQAKGKPIPENDIWIAATSKQHSLTLVTRDNHFTEVDKLLMEIW